MACTVCVNGTTMGSKFSLGNLLTVTACGDLGSGLVAITDRPIPPQQTNIRNAEFDQAVSGKLRSPYPDGKLVMDLREYSTEQLKQLLDAIPAELKRREKETKVKLRQELEELARKHGFSLDELLGEHKPTKVKGSVAPKYRHPTDASLTWAGRGRKPLWVSSLLDAGSTLEALLIT